VSLDAERRPLSQTASRVTVYQDGSATQRTDKVVTEEPLEMRVSKAGSSSRPVAVTMRTPGADFELAAGFLFGEGVVTSRDDIRTISYCRDEDLPPEQLYNIVIVEVAPSTQLDIASLERHFHMTSACGVCGKASIDALELRGIAEVAKGTRVSPETIRALPERLMESQKLFAATGGLHAAGLFDRDGSLIAAREDVGRHNAVDKLVGWAMLDGRVPLSEQVLMVSGRSSYEIVQKAATAGIAVVCSVSAPSSLAIDVARRFGITLVGFVRDDRFTVYTGAERIA
jgi:FdhD protein